MKKFSLTVLLAGFYIAAYSQSPSAYAFQAKECYEPGERCEATVIAWSGLRLREKADFKARSIAVIPYRETVRFIRESDEAIYQKEQFLDSDSISGYWQKVDWREKSGYVFSAYLTDAVWKMDQPSYLLYEETAWCWNDAYISKDYQYYGVYADADTTVLRIKKLQPIFYTRVELGWGESLTTFRFKQPRQSFFALAVKEPIAELSCKVKTSGQYLRADYDTGMFSDSEKIDIPDSPWEIKGKYELAESGNPGAGSMPRPYLRDKKTGAWHYLFSEKYIGASQVKLLWSGDLDGDGIADFMLAFGSEHSGGNALFLSGNPGKWHFVRLAGIYWWGDCC